MITTPPLYAIWPNLNTPNLKFDAKGVYDVTVLLDPKEETHAAFIHSIEEMYEKAISDMAAEHKKPKIKRADSPIRPVTDKEGNDLGTFKIKFKLAASGETKDGRKYERKPALFGADGKPFTGVVGHNAKVRVAFKPTAFFAAALGAGLSLRLEAVQVLEAGGQRGFADFGFTAAAEPEASAAPTDMSDTEF